MQQGWGQSERRTKRRHCYGQTMNVSGRHKRRHFGCVILDCWRRRKDTLQCDGRGTVALRIGLIHAFLQEARRTLNPGSDVKPRARRG